jgi:hypothetical protein
VARKNLTLDQDTNITTLILDCDLEISMDRCTTALEAWAAGKPTIELAFERHPMLSGSDREALNVQCRDPSELVALIDGVLADPAQSAYRSGRRDHLVRWLVGPDGNSSRRVAEAIVRRIRASNPRGPRGGFTFAERKKAAKLKLLRGLDLPYNWQPWMPIRRRVQPTKSELSWRKQQKAIRPSDVRQMMDRLQSIQLDGPP